MSDCVFCDIIAGKRPHPKRFKRAPGFVMFEPLDPVTPGHLLVVPRRHANDAAAGPVMAAWAMLAAALVSMQLRTLHGLDSNIITSVGPNATQTIEHTHLHVVPRRPGDGLVLPWTGQQSDNR
jgi:histidine triad (HIT) family protein